METSGIVPPAPASKSEGARFQLAEDLDAFLLLLTTQLKHQDPLSPLEPTEFTNQLVNFANVEQAIATNKHLEDLLALEASNFVSSIVGFIGTQVEANGNVVPLQDGKAEFRYALSDAAKFATLTIADAGGNVVHSAQLENTAGVHSYVWDGKDQNGIQQPNGPYKISVTAASISDDRPVETSVVLKGRVTGVNMQDGTFLDVGGVVVPLEDILTVNEYLPPAQDPDPGEDETPDEEEDPVT
jgi:flagellar basal-body rod modification protein FlgD